MKRDFNGGILPPRCSLLMQRVLPIGDYVKELSNGCKLTKPICVQLNGSKVVPIPVPLSAHESLVSYEDRFREWLLAKRATTVESLREMPNQECNYRFYFARKLAREYEVLMNSGSSVRPAIASASVSPTHEEIRAQTGDEVDADCRSSVPALVDGEGDEVADGPARKILRTEMKHEVVESAKNQNKNLGALWHQGDESKQDVDIPSETQTVHLVLQVWKNDLEELEALLNSTEAVNYSDLQPDLGPAISVVMRSIIARYLKIQPEVTGSVPGGLNHEDLQQSESHTQMVKQALKTFLKCDERFREVVQRALDLVKV